MEFAFSAFSLSVWQKEHLACKNSSNEMLAWLSIWGEVKMICISSS